MAAQNFKTKNVHKKLGKLLPEKWLHIHHAKRSAELLMFDDAIQVADVKVNNTIKYFMIINSGWFIAGEKTPQQRETP